ncbi:MAG: PAAR-like domain-containing protein [Burkholderiaceae bacterium]
MRRDHQGGAADAVAADRAGGSVARPGAATPSVRCTSATAFPDVCKTPSPGGPIPVPYPNIGQATDKPTAASRTRPGRRTIKPKIPRPAKAKRRVTTR